jgi:uncharacterized protein with HEPN domain
MPRSEAQRLQDMRDACRRIAEFVHGLDFASFSADYGPFVRCSTT